MMASSSLSRSFLVVRSKTVSDLEQFGFELFQVLGVFRGHGDTSLQYGFSVLCRAVGKGEHAA